MDLLLVIHQQCGKGLIILAWLSKNGLNDLPMEKWGVEKEIETKRTPIFPEIKEDESRRAEIESCLCVYNC